ncbi:hypothetical protein [Kribbella sp. NPDC055071]
MAVGLTARTLVRMRLAAFRHALRDPNRLTWICTGAFVGLVLAGGTIWSAAGDSDLLVVALAVWMLGWVVGPLFAGGGDETLKPEYFAMLPIPPRTLAAGLLTAALAGVAPIISLIALLSLVVAGGQLSVVAAVVAVPALVLQLFCFILASRLAVAVYGVLLQIRAGAVIAGLVNAFILAFMAQGWALIVAFVSTDVQGTMAKAARIAPSGWGLVAVEAAGRNDWLKAVLALAGLLLLGALMLLAWSALLVRRTAATRTGGKIRRVLSATGPRGAAGAKELRSWTRDVLYGYKAVFAISYGLFFCLMPLAVGWKAMLPWAGAATVIMAGAMSSNLYGSDGTALWTTLMTPGSARPDVRARQRAFVLVFGPPALVITLLLTWWSGSSSAWPLVLSVLPALLGGAAGLVVACSVYAAVPTTDAHKRSGNPLNSGENEGETMGLVYVMLVLVSITAGPALLVALAASWWGVPVGVLTGVLLWWSLGRAAATRLDRRGPELLTLLRHGRSTPTQSKQTTSLESLPRWRRTTAGLCLGFGAIPLVPQAVVPTIFKLTGNAGTKSWFLALYAGPRWQWSVIAAMAALGLSMYTYAGLTYLNAKKTLPATLE